MMMKHVFSFVLLGLGAAALGGCPIYSDDQRSNRVCVGSDCYSCPDPYISNDCYAFSCYADTRLPGRVRLRQQPPLPADRRRAARPHRRHALHEALRLPERLDLRRGQQVPHRRLLERRAARRTSSASSAGGVPTCEPVGDDGGMLGVQERQRLPDPRGLQVPERHLLRAGRSVRRRHAVRGRLAVRAGCMHPVVQRDQALPDRLRVRRREGRLHRQHRRVHQLEPVRRRQGLRAAALRRLRAARAQRARPASSASTAAARRTSSRSSRARRTAPRTSASRAASASVTAATSRATRTRGADACKSADKFNVCKSVTTSSGAHSVCGSDTNLGTDCDPTQGKNCASPLICIDGFCR